MVLSNLYRSVAPWHPAVAYAWGCALVIGALAAVSHGLASGVHGGLAVFLGWAVVRELAPSRLVPGIVAPWASLPFVIPSDADLLACVLVLIAARVVSHTAGGAPTLLDCAGVVVLCAVAASHLAAAPVALVLAAALFAQGARRHRLAGAVALVTVLALGSVEGTLTIRAMSGSLNRAEQVLVGILVVAAIVTVIRSAPATLRERADRGRSRLVGRRIRAARITAVATIGVVALWTGVIAPFALAAASGALVAVALSGPGYRSAAPPSDTLQS